MARFIPLTESNPNVTFTFELEQEQESVRGHFGYETEEENTESENEILERLDAGDERAWCQLKVTATYTDPVTGVVTEESDSLGCVNLGTDAGWGPALEQHVRETFPELWSEALDWLNATLQRKHTPRVVRMCTVKYSGPTDSHGSRYRARHCTTKRSVVVSYDPGLDEFENACAAAEKLFGRRPEFTTSVDGGGYIMGVDPRNDPPSIDG